MTDEVEREVGLTTHKLKNTGSDMDCLVVVRLNFMPTRYESREEISFVFAGDNIDRTRKC